MIKPIPEIHLLLLDLGGVLVELDADAARAGWFDPSLSSEENWRKWLGSESSQALERGEIAPAEFAASLIKEYQLDISVEQFIDYFRKWVVGFYPGVFPLLERVLPGVTLGVFSNVTDVHWTPLYDALVSKTRIRHYFASYLIGYAKPDLDAYRFVCAQAGVNAAQVLFVDDNRINVEGARAAGLLAEQVQGPKQLEQVLQDYRLLDAAT